MAAEENNENIQEIQKDPVDDGAQNTHDGKENDKTEERSEMPERQKSRKVKYGIFLLAVVVVVAVSTVKPVRENVIQKYNEFLTSVRLKQTGLESGEQLSERIETPTELNTERLAVGSFDQTEADENVRSEEVVSEQTQTSAVENQDMAIRLEQLENERDFKNAEVIVASVEQESQGNVDATALIDQQKALLAEIERLRAVIEQIKADTQQQIEQIQTDTQKQIEQMQMSASQKKAIEEHFLEMNSRQDAFERQLLEKEIQINRLEKNKADASSVLALMVRMDAAEQKIKISNAQKERMVDLLLALYQMREAAYSGQSFLTQQQAVLELSSSLPQVGEKVRSLSAAADQGIFTKAALIRSFSDYADKAVIALSASPKTDWFHQAMNSLKSLIVVRRIEAKAKDLNSPQNILARAQQAVNDGDLALAVTILSDLQGNAAEMMKEWKTEAQRYLNTKKVIDETVAIVLSDVNKEQLQGEQ